jgi:hypothetical protein
MSADFLDTQLTAYLSLREALGFQMRAEKILLPGVQLKLMAASKLSGLLEFLLGPVIVPRPIGPVNA